MVMNSDVDGFRSSTWGMTPNQVKESIGINLSEHDKSEENSSTVLVGGPEKIGNLNCEIKFLFNEEENTLYAVNLIPKKEFQDAAFNILKDMLTSKYGDPNSYNEEESGGIIRREKKAKWNFRSTKISLTYTEFDSDQPYKGTTSAAYSSVGEDELNKI